MAEAKVTSKKQGVVSKIADELNQSEVAYFVNFRGMTVSEITNFRSELTKVNAKATVYKNTMTRLALKSLDISYPKEYLIGPSMMITSNDDIVDASKVLMSHLKLMKSLEVKGGLLKNKILLENDIKQLASLPSKEVLLGKVVGGIKAPITNFVMQLSSPLRGFALVLKAIQEKK